MNYEDVLNSIGGLGCYQYFLCLLLSLSTFRYGIDVPILFSFHPYTPEYACQHPYQTNFSKENKTGQCSQMNVDSGNMSVCDSFIFSNDTAIKSSLVTQFGLICERSYWVVLFQSLPTVGCMVSTFIGSAGDFIGRRRLFLIGCTLESLTSLLIAAISQQLHVQLLLRFFRFVGLFSTFHGLLILLEVTPMKSRSIMGCTYWMMFSFGYTFSAAILYFFPYWNLMQYASAATCIIYIACFFFIPESPRWLMQQHRQKDAIKVFQTIAKWNKRCVSEEFFDNVAVHKEPQDSWNHLFQNSGLIAIISVMSLVLCVANLLFMAMTIDPMIANESIFVTVIVMGLIEAPPSPIAWLVMDRIGRRATSCISLLGGGVAMFVICFLYPGGWLRMIMALLAKLFVCITFGVYDVYLIEALPTSLRSKGYFIAIFCGYVGSFVSPYISSLVTKAYYIPGVIHAVLSIITVALTYFVLPETLGCPLAQTLEESNYLRRGNEEEFKKFMKCNEKSNIVLIESNGVAEHKL